MKIGTLNIDWFKKSNATKNLIIDEINKQYLDFLIINENILAFTLHEKYFAYHTVPLPINQEFQHLDYGKYLKGETPIRTSIYSKYKSIKQIDTIDPYTSLCHKFIVEEKEICIYGTIIGTYGIKYQNEIVKPELEHFKADIENILTANKNIIIAGDFNTSFDKAEKRDLSTIKSRDEIVHFTDKYLIHRITGKMLDSIDHIFVSQALYGQTHITTSTFLENNILKDKPHHGILLDVNFIG